MNRRNFILGLGTAATLSGAASVTGAALSNTVDSTANFQIVATNELIVRKNEELTSSSLGSNANYSDTTISEFDAANATDDPTNTPNLTVNQSTNGDLGIAFATPNDNSSDFNRNFSLGGTEPYNETRRGSEVTTVGGANNGRVAPLQIENNGGSQKDVAVEYVLGSDVNTGSLTASGLNALDVAELFTFGINGTQISPPADSGSLNLDGDVLEITDPNTEFNLGAGNVEEVDFKINMSKRLEDLIADASSGSYSFTESSSTGVSLLSEVRFGTNTQ